MLAMPSGPKTACVHVPKKAPACARHLREGAVRKDLFVRSARGSHVGRQRSKRCVEERYERAGNERQKREPE